MTSEGLERTDYTLSTGRAYLLGSLLYLVILIACVGPYVVFSGAEFPEAAVAAFDYPGLVLLGLFIGFVVLHELLHGVGFHYFGGVPWSEVRYGFNWKVLVPYASTSRPMPVTGYRWAALLPLLLTGLLPAFIGTVMGDARLVSFSAFMAGGAGGDVLVVWLIRKLPPTAIVRDSSTRIGCEVVGSDFA